MDRIGSIAQQLSSGAVVGMIVVHINNMILARPRAMLEIYYLNGKHQEKDLSLKLRSTLLTIFLSSFLMLSIVVVAGSILQERELYTGLLESVIRKERTIEQVADE
ncbi:MAG: hypothetical protein V3S41_01905 [Spirochaetia bacterium]